MKQIHLGGKNINTLKVLNLTNKIHYFLTFGKAAITKGIHLEKFCLINDRIGRDHINDFSTNLTKEFLLEYPQSNV